jgi:hypothetical protein
MLRCLTSIIYTKSSARSLFTDIVSSTERLADIGDERGRNELDARSYVTLSRGLRSGEQHSWRRLPRNVRMSRGALRERTQHVEDQRVESP